MMATTAALIIFLAVAGPLAALLINHQRRSLEEKVIERNNLINQYAAERRSSKNRITELGRQLRSLGRSRQPVGILAAKAR